jgi:hypothetical protein
MLAGSGLFSASLAPFDRIITEELPGLQSGPHIGVSGEVQPRRRAPAIFVPQVPAIHEKHRSVLPMPSENGAPQKTKDGQQIWWQKPGSRSLHLTSWSSRC